MCTRRRIRVKARAVGILVIKPFLLLSSLTVHAFLKSTSMNASFMGLFRRPSLNENESRASPLFVVQKQIMVLNEQV